MKIGVFTNYDEVFKPVADITVPRMESYCKKHGYTFCADTQKLTPFRVVWEKFRVLKEVVPHYDWSLYLDTDVLITNPEIKLEKHLDDSSEVIVAMDMNGLNCGAMFFKRTPGVIKLIEDTLRKATYPEITSEQHGFIETLADAALSVKYRLAPQRHFNSYPYELYNLPATTIGNWEPGDFAMHLPGMTVAQRVEIFNRYL